MAFIIAIFFIWLVAHLVGAGLRLAIQIIAFLLVFALALDVLSFVWNAAAEMLSTLSEWTQQHWDKIVGVAAAIVGSISLVRLILTRSRATAN